MTTRFTGPGPLRLISYVVGISAALMIHFSADWPVDSRKTARIAAFGLATAMVILFLAHHVRRVYSASKQLSRERDKRS